LRQTKGKSRQAKGNASPLGRQAIEIIEREIARFRGIVCFQRFDRFLISPLSAQDPPRNHKARQRLATSRAGPS
jgi:hypothetical protein